MLLTLAALVGSAPFSILGRIELTATWPPSGQRGWGRRSFSILGRIELTATAAYVSEMLAQSFFQYPRSDRAHCNWERTHYGWRCYGIFQYPRSDRAHCNFPRARSRASRSLASFSILGRIELTATLIETERESDAKTFQYPRSDRAHCNPQRGRPSDLDAATFSILGRIEPTATRGRTWCASRATSLSVSSVGSSPLQRRAMDMVRRMRG